MTTQLIHIVGPQCEARDWLVETLARGLRGAGHGGALLEVMSDYKSNDELRRFPILGRVALVLATTRQPRHDDLADSDLLITHVPAADGGHADPHGPLSAFAVESARRSV